MKWIATVSGLALALCLFTVSPVFAAEDKETKKDDEEQKIVLPEHTELNWTTEGGGFFKFAGVGMFAASGADVVTTEWGLQQDGIYEGNPVSTNRGVRIATHVAAPAVVYWATEEMHKKGRKKLALAIRIGLMVAYSYVAIHNIRTVNEP
jgi:hypothetical protein